MVRIEKTMVVSQKTDVFFENTWDVSLASSS